MSRTKLADRPFPDYTKGEEVMNMVTHIVGAAFGVLALVMCILRSCEHGNVWGIVSSSIYGGSIITLYSVSAVYHGLPKNMGKKVMQVIDHCTIFLLIAGSYTPITLAGIRTASVTFCWIIFGIVWGISAVGTVFTAIDHDKYATFSMSCYIGIGWCLLIALKPTIQAMTLEGFLWLLSGGLMYTIGAVFYVFASRNQSERHYIHSVFHIFVVAGTILQFWSIYKYIL
ncbi:MAG: hemolysin III family protein [Lachnospiraceae bacterium]|nr:hemolysin III family protein [Lachnospiraceae bacterium]